MVSYIKTEAVKAREAIEDQDDDSPNFLIFEKLVSRGTNKMVVAQAFHHTLQLATLAMINVSQEEPFGTIKITCNI
jgi:chromatin segregation and condensation protein Rec8/ScpA/Scc1 (kleisin family)